MPDQVPHILHEADVRKVVEDQVELSVGQTGAAIDDISVPFTLAASYSNTEVAAAINDVGEVVNLILAVLRTNGLIEVEV